MTVTRIVLVDDHSMVLSGMSAALSAEASIEVIGEASNGAEAIQLVMAMHPDVVVMDIVMPVLDGVEATRRIRAADRTCRVILLTTFDDDDYVFNGLCAGAAGYLLKNEPIETLVHAIQAVARGGSMLDPSVAQKVVSEFARLAPSYRRTSPIGSLLTEREQRVLFFVAQGLKNREIADRLGITELTVKRHISNILPKLAVSSRSEAAEQARVLGLL